MSSTRTPADSATPDARSSHPETGTHTVRLLGVGDDVETHTQQDAVEMRMRIPYDDVEVRLVPVDHEDGDEDYHVYLEPVSDGDPALGTVTPLRPDGIWTIRFAPRYKAVTAADDLTAALRTLLELTLDEDLNPKYVEIPSRAEADEPSNDSADARVIPTPRAVPSEVRDRVTVRETGPDDYSVELDGESIGVVKPSEEMTGYWAFTDESDMTADGETLGGAVSELVEYVLRYDMLGGRFSRAGEQSEDAVDAPALEADDEVAAELTIHRASILTDRDWEVWDGRTRLGWITPADGTGPGWWGYARQGCVTGHGVALGDAVASILEELGYDPDAYLA